MRISPFELERYFAEHEFSVPYLLCCSDCESLAVGELTAMEEGAADALQRLWLGYTESQGHPLLREQIASLYAGIGLEHVLVHAGAEEAIFNLMNVWLQPGDHVIVHSPCYQSLFEVARAIGCEVTPWQTTQETDWALDMDWLRDHLRPETRLVVINCPHNPTGYLMPRDRFDDLVSLSQQHGFLLFSDEVYRWLEYDARDRLPALCEVDERGISLGVMSKSFGLAGLRIGWIATRNADLYARLAAFKDYTTICCSAPSELLSIVALRNRDRILRRNLEIVQENLGLLDRFFADHAALFSWSRPRAGPIAFPSFKGGDVERFCGDLVTQAGVLLLPGTMYGPGYAHFRIGFGRRNVRECLEALDAYLEQGWKAR